MASPYGSSAKASSSTSAEAGRSLTIQVRPASSLRAHVGPEYPLATKAYTESCALDHLDDRRPRTATRRSPHNHRHTHRQHRQRRRSESAPSHPRPRQPHSVRRPLETPRARRWSAKPPPQRHEPTQREQVGGVTQGATAKHRRSHFRDTWDHLERSEPDRREQQTGPPSHNDSRHDSNNDDTGNIAQLAGPPTRHDTLQHVIVHQQHSHRSDEERVCQPTSTDPHPFHSAHAIGAFSTVNREQPSVTSRVRNHRTPRPPPAIRGRPRSNVVPVP